MPLAGDIDIDALAKDSEGLSGAETSLVCREAGLMALTQDSTIEKLNTAEEIAEFKVSKEHVLKALEGVKNRGKGDTKHHL